MDPGLRALDSAGLALWIWVDSGELFQPLVPVSSSMSRAESRAQMEERVRSSVGSAQYTPGILGVPRRVSAA